MKHIIFVVIASVLLISCTVGPNKEIHTPEEIKNVDIVPLSMTPLVPYISASDNLNSYYHQFANPTNYVIESEDYIFYIKIS